MRLSAMVLLAASVAGGLVAPSGARAEAPSEQEVRELLARKLGPHPRLLLRGGDVPALRARILADPQLAAVERILHAEVDRTFDEPPSERLLTGRRLLSVSREFMSRVVGLSMEYRLTGERRYAERAKREMLAVAAFEDWHPDHFLDVAEIAAGMAIGYDWTFDTLTPEERAALRAAMVSKGLDPSSAGKPFWLNGTNNWNQVCNGGLALAALAVAEDDPKRASAVVSRAVASLPYVMKGYAPSGAYPEGPGYWEYGTTYNVLLISGLESAIGTDFGLKREPGFLETADYMLHETGPTGQWFNYSDCGQRGGFSPAVAMWWFAAERGDPTLLFNERRLLGAALQKPPAKVSSDMRRMLSFLLVWAMGAPAPSLSGAPATASGAGRAVDEPKTRWYVAAGPTPVALMRSGWTQSASFFGIKGGSPSTSHAHMDVGSFVADIGGVRWADDLGMQDYNSLESKKVDLWNMKQSSQRWQVFRLGASSHNILTVDGKDQIVGGQAKITRSGDGFAIVETTPVYAGQLARATRGIRLASGGAIRVQDEVVGDDAPHTVRWAMVTRADVEIGADGTAALIRSGKKLRLVSSGAAWKVYATDLVHAYDAPNPGTRIVGFEFLVPPGSPRRVVVDLLPDDASSDDVAPLSEWR